MTVPPTNGNAVLPQAIDLSHHLNSLSRARQPSPLKFLFKYAAIPNLLSFAGGVPHPSYFPFHDTTISAYPFTADPSSFPSNPTEGDLLPLLLPKYGSKGNDLATALQYGASTGHPTLVKWAREFTQEIFKPAYGDWEILLNDGNTDAWSKIVRLLLEPGDTLLTEEYTFPSAQAAWIPLGVTAVPIKMDEHGLRADHLSKTLAEWETTRPGVRRPKLLYIIPVGSNPTGSTMPAHRRQEIYDLAVEYDIIIAEDDPYTFLQFPQYTVGDKTAVVPQSGEDFKKSLVPSFLNLDTQGRVIRLDTFSKTIGPGFRVGYFVANPLFTERLLRSTEVDSQAPSGWSQAILASLLTTWKNSGYLHWLSNLRDQYTLRRNHLIDSLASSFDLRPAGSTAIPNAEGLVAFLEGSEIPVFSFVPPTGGMFLWLKFYLTESPNFKSFSAEEDPEQAFMTHLFEELATKATILLVPGAYYSPWQGKDKTTTAARGEELGVGYFRVAYSMATNEEMEEGVRRFEIVIRKEWEL
ncbi:pyridoxal phosphate-dependent transferase [Leucosporidium creatinivorum]|uniref:Pyridoxal phosphate-dependent transferase n=1 Tax=Leucosporidium creatinivorum TaxID=106004 RepID=A0A1Y2ECK7_9BASI|nr:pyridoxal phosphate-dependent transferase [Leucosporidium creatinivorum]